MTAKVELINNPYTQRLRILINNEAVSVYSNLEKYMDEPFVYWCDKILNEIYEECNQAPFFLYFQSRKEELEIMEKLALEYPHCMQYFSSPFLRPTSLLDRMKELNALIRGIQNSGYQTFCKYVLFILPENLKRLEDDLKNLEVKNSFCEIKSIVMFYQEYLREKPGADVIFLLSDGKAIEDSMQRLNVNRDFGICIGNEKSFQQKIGEMFIYKTKEDSIFETIFNCLLLAPLLEMFNLCIDSLSNEIKEKYKEKLEELQSISIKIIPVPEKTTIEVGKSSRIRFESDLEGYQVKSSQLHYTYSEKDIIRCNGLLVEGIKEGKATLLIYKEGEKLPCAKVDYTVIKRNRITKLTLEDDFLTIGEGDRTRLKYTFLPPDADNVNSIEWHSDNNKVAFIDRYGNLQAVGTGRCTIRCLAEQVSASCKCIVKPHLKSITPDSTDLEMIYGREQDIRINLFPEDCVDDEIVINSMDMRIANVVGRTVKAIGIGRTRIIIQNKEETVRSEINVHVMTEKEFKKLQKQREKNNMKKDGKNSWLSKLFG